MSRAFTPPETLSKEEIRTIADVRREIWTNGFRGLAFGSLAGWTSHLAAKIASQRFAGARRLFGNVAFGPNTAMLSFMSGGALGSFAFATAAGKNSVHHLHPVLENNRRVDANVNQGSMYQIMVARAKQEEAEKEEEKQRVLKEHAERKIQRRRTMKDRWESQSESRIVDDWNSTTFSTGDSR